MHDWTLPCICTVARCLRTWRGTYAGHWAAVVQTSMSVIHCVHNEKGCLLPSMGAHYNQAGCEE
jgi:hypothetical protein